MEPLKSSSRAYTAVSGFFRRWNIDPAKGILIAASGGIDSTALMALLARFRDSLRTGLSLHGLYVNHNLRTAEEIEADWRRLCMAAELCRVPVHRCDIPEGSIERSAVEMHEGVEAAARRARYAALDTWLDRLGLEYMALGHTLDDLAETMIMRFFQGCGVSGLHGIPPVSGKRIRPLLDVSKEELGNLVAELELPVSEDSSNREDWYLRNRIRSELMPVLLREFPSLAGSLGKSARFFRQEEAVLQDEAHRRIPWSLGKEGAEIEASRFFSAPEALRIRSLLSLIHYYLPGSSRIPRNFLSVKDLSHERKNIVLLRGHGFTLHKSADRLFFNPSVVFPAKTRYVKRIFRGSDGSFAEFRYAWGSRLPDGGPRTAIALPGCSRDEPLFLRSRRLTDSIRTAGGNKRLKDVYRELGIPEDSRDAIPVLQIGKEIAAVFGSLFGYRDVLAVGFWNTDPQPQAGDVLSIQRMETGIGR
jgi:tRNA(Ile)-lysidine synthase